ncbi:MAG: hydantoinase [Hyphomicrobiales bacterium]|nr:MAG: hydantoinase [Hyphomicrobiales bacterium]
MHVGVEVGGTFTDLIAVDGETLVVRKVRSTPANPEVGALNALDTCGIGMAQVADLAHGSTVATNAVLERRGPRVAFVTTAGFRDILFLQRQARRQVFDLAYANPAPIVDRASCFEVVERTRADGTVETALEPARVAGELVPALKAGGFEVVAICLLNSYVNPQNELRLAQAIREHLPQLQISASHDVARQFREYERASTTAVSGFVQPVVDQYLLKLEAELGRRGFAGAFSVMQSNGGRMPAQAMRRNAVAALYSGPAAGVMGAVYQVGKSDVRNLITFDMGGTSTDVCLVDNGAPILTSSTEIDGLPIQTPVLDIVTVGGGGGSIVWIDEGGMVRVGPQSAGADPGPACYGFGGTLPTITDAQLLTGTLRPDRFGQGAIALDRAAAERAFAPIASHMATGVEEAAAGAIKLVNAVIVRAIQRVSTARGRDPRDYALVPFGGAGPLHAAEVADELGINRVVVPPRAGVVSALGLVSSEYRRYATVTRLLDADSSVGEIVSTFAQLRRDLCDEFARLGHPTDSLAFEHVLEMRYKGQAFEIQTPLSQEELGSLSAAGLRKKFAYEHNRALNHAGRPDAPIEIVNFRVGAQTRSAKDISLIGAAGEGAASGGDGKEGRVFVGGSWQECAFHDELHLGAGATITGNAIVEGDTSTAFIPAGWTATRDGSANLIVERN